MEDSRDGLMYRWKFQKALIRRWLIRGCRSKRRKLMHSVRIQRLWPEKLAQAQVQVVALVLDALGMLEEEQLRCLRRRLLRMRLRWFQGSSWQTRLNVSLWPRPKSGASMRYVPSYIQLYWRLF